MRTTLPGRCLLLLAPVLLSCSDPSAPRTPTSIAVVSGGGQTAPVTGALPQPVVVEVKDVDGRPIRGVTVAWTVMNGGGSVSAASTKTDRTGQASVEWTLGPESGQNRIHASVEGVAPISITAIAQAGPPAQLEVVTGDGQTGLVNLRLGRPIRVRVRDGFGNSVPGVTVSFTPASGSVTAQSALSNVNGLAQTVWTLGPDTGSQTLTVTAPGTADAEVTVTALTPGQVDLLENGVPVGSVAAALGEDRFYRIALPASVTRLEVSISGIINPEDPDLYVLGGALPSISAFDCRAATLSTTETCVIQTPAEGDWYVLIDAYSAYDGVTVHASWEIGGDVAVDITGLPQGVAAGLTLTGGGSFSRTIDESIVVPALLPGTYTLSAYNVIDGATVYTTTPSAQQVTVTSGGVENVTVAYTEASGLNLDITDVYITQGVQRTNGSVPLIAGRDGLVRVLARASGQNSETPDVRVRVYHNGGLVETFDVAAPAAAVPIISDEGEMISTWNVRLDGSLIQPGTSLLVDVDPDDAVTETNESDNTYPASGSPLALDVRTAAPMRARLVPVWQDGHDDPADVNSSNIESYITLARAIYPFPDMDVDVRAPLTFDKVLPASYDTIWGRLLNELLQKRTDEGSDRYYYGVIRPGYQSGGTGVGYIGLPAALGVDWQNGWREATLAHEWGHNFGRRHVACGGPSGTDPDYPHTSRPGALGPHGWDARTNTVVSGDTAQDIMSYCRPYWASDYTYEAVLAFRAAEAVAAAEPSLLVWGRISPDGVVLEPAYEVVTRPNVPKRRGAYRLTGTDAQGATVLDLSFDGYEVAHLPGVRHFAYAIPLRMLRGSPRELRLRGAAGEARRVAQPGPPPDVHLTRIDARTIRVQWDAARSPMVVVRDPRTRAVLSFARGGDARVATDAREIDVNVSDGVRSGMRRGVVAR